MNLSSHHLIKILEQNGFLYLRAKGSHHIYYNEQTKKLAIIPVHKGKDLKLGTFMGILKQAGIDKDKIK